MDMVAPSVIDVPLMAFAPLTRSTIVGTGLMSMVLLRVLVVLESLTIMPAVVISKVSLLEFVSLVPLSISATIAPMPISLPIVMFITLVALISMPAVVISKGSSLEFVSLVPLCISAINKAMPVALTMDTFMGSLAIVSLMAYISMPVLKVTLLELDVFSLDGGWNMSSISVPLDTFGMLAAIHVAIRSMVVVALLKLLSFSIVSHIFITVALDPLNVFQKIVLLMSSRASVKLLELLILPPGTMSFVVGAMVVLKSAMVVFGIGTQKHAKGISVVTGVALVLMLRVRLGSSVVKDKSNGVVEVSLLALLRLLVRS